MDYKNITPIELLEKLSLAFGPSGCEDNVSDIIREFITPFADEVFEDRLGTLIAKYAKRAEKTAYDSDSEPDFAPDSPDCGRLMLCAHMDEVGFMIKAIDGDGFLKIKAISGKDPTHLTGRRVTVGDENKKVNGYFGVKPVHLGGVGDFDSMFVDIGAKDKEDAEKYVSVGDFGTYRSDFVVFGEDGSKIKGKAMDDRFGCTVLCMVLRHLSENKVSLPFDVYFAFTRREEIGASGAKTAANTINPDIAIVIEATAVNDIEGEKNGFVAKQGMGGCVTMMDRGTVYDREIFDYIMNTAKKHSIPVQTKNSVTGTNDASPIQRALSGVKCAAVSAPARYIHTASNVIDRRDMDSVIRLITAAVTDLS